MLNAVNAVQMMMMRLMGCGDFRWQFLCIRKEERNWKRKKK